jgi:hypothetical protein
MIANLFSIFFLKVPFQAMILLKWPLNIFTKLIPYQK